MAVLKRSQGKWWLEDSSVIKTLTLHIYTTLSPKKLWQDLQVSIQLRNGSLALLKTRGPCGSAQDTHKMYMIHIKLCSPLSSHQVIMRFFTSGFTKEQLGAHEREQR